MSWLRKVRAIAGMALIWGIAWVSLTLATVLRTSVLYRSWPDASLLREAITVGLLAGGLSGALFGGLLAWSERGQTVAGLTARRVAGSGVLAGLLPAAFSILAAVLRDPDLGPSFGIVTIMGITGVLGATCAGALLWIVRRAPTLPDERAVPELTA